MDKIDDDLSQTQTVINKPVEPVTVNNNTDYEIFDIKDPVIRLYLNDNESQGLMNADFLEFFTI